MRDRDLRRWDARWISFSPDPRQDLGVFGFRRRFELEAVPPELWVRVSADQRYKLYVNGEIVGFGPQRGDAAHWFYEVYELTPFLRKGENWLAALVWNFGRWAPMAQMSVRTAFVAEFAAELRDFGLERTETPNVFRPAPMPESDEEGHLRCTDVGESVSGFPGSLSTPLGWEVARLDHWSFDMLHSHHIEWYIDVGPGEVVDFLGAPWGWRVGEDTQPAQANWRTPNSICGAEERGAGGGGTPWMLIPRTLPPMEYRVRNARPLVRRGFSGDVLPSSGEGVAKDGDVLGSETLLRTGTPVLLDYGELLCAFPRLCVEGPQGATLTLTYCEALFDESGAKGHRNEVLGKQVRGYQDKFILDGKPRTIETLWWRTYRYLLLEAHVPPGGPEEGILLHKLEAVETGYPLHVESSFEADDPWVERIWGVSLRTARRCAGETYFDCPYYEQLQYAGDTRIQALIGYYLGRDRALQRNAIRTLKWSLMPNGLTQSRYPSRQIQVIPPFSLWWALMVYDYLLHTSDPDFGFACDPIVGQVVESFAKTEGESEGPFWQFLDWVPEWKWGVPPGGARATPHRICAWMAQVARTLGANPELASGSRSQSLDQLWHSLSQKLEARSGLIRHVEDPEGRPSEHAEALFRVAQLMANREPDPWPSAELQRTGASKCTFYFSYYKHMAMFGRASAPFDYLAELQPWKEMIESGLTTFAETPEPTRSDCHAWSAHPILGFFQFVAGVTSTSLGWESARVEPHPGSLRRFEALIAHPKGPLGVKFEDGRLQVDSPVPFEIVWQGKRETLPAGSALV